VEEFADFLSAELLPIFNRFKKTQVNFAAERARLGEQGINMMSAVPREQPSAYKENASGQNEVEIANEYEVVISAMGRRGDGIARVGGLVVFVPGAKVGDHVKIRIKSLWPTFAVGDLID